ncbi:hypothetical protein IWX48DRAFT_585483, partial [Phyllosticta citricarpa]
LAPCPWLPRSESSSVCCSYSSFFLIPQPSSSQDLDLVNRHCPCRCNPPCPSFSASPPARAGAVRRSKPPHPPGAHAPLHLVRPELHCTALHLDHPHPPSSSHRFARRHSTSPPVEYRSRRPDNQLGPARLPRTARLPPRAVHQFHLTVRGFATLAPLLRSADHDPPQP